MAPIPTYDLTYGEMIRNVLAGDKDRYFRPTEVAGLVPELTTHQAAVGLVRLADNGLAHRVRLTKTRSVFAYQATDKD